jgi:hypothetical protein
MGKELFQNLRKLSFEADQGLLGPQELHDHLKPFRNIL